MMKINSIEHWCEDSIIIRDTEDIQYQVKSVDAFQNALTDTIQFDHQDLDYIHHLGWSEFARDKHEELQEYINFFIEVDSLMIEKYFDRLLETKRDKFERLVQLRNSIVLQKDEAGRRAHNVSVLKERSSYSSLIFELNKILEELKK